MFADTAGDASQNVRWSIATACRVILGVTGTLELVIPLGARLGHPKWKRAMKDAGVADDAADDVVAAHRRRATSRGRRTASPACSATSSPGGSPTGSTSAAPTASSTPRAPARCQRRPPRGAGTADRAGRRRRHRRRRHVQRHLHVHVLQQDAGPVADRATRSRSTPTATAPSSARGSGVVVLKRLADAERDGDTIYAVLRGVGSSQRRQGQRDLRPERRRAEAGACGPPTSSPA